MADLDTAVSSESAALPLRLKGIAGIKAHAGRHLGTSSWLRVDQERINLFADATGDHDWIHVNPELAKDGPFGKTIAHGYLTLSMVFALLREVYVFEDIKMGLNYGIDRLRFPAPVPVDSNIRVDVFLKEAKDVPDGVQMTVSCTIECDAMPKPAVVADLVFRFYEKRALT
jgi:acyl dehydratase